jgi:hypothetical protein
VRRDSEPGVRLSAWIVCLLACAVGLTPAAAEAQRLAPQALAAHVLAARVLRADPVAAGERERRAPTTPNGGETAPAAAQPADVDEDRRVDLLQPDFNLAALPTTLRVPHRKWNFRVTHRFTRPLGEGDFASLVENLFGLDSSALVGLGFRYGLRPGTQIGIHRMSSRTILLFGQHNALRERDGHPLGLDVLVGLEGENNLRQHRQGVFGILLSRSAGTRGVGYVQPIVVTNANPTAAGDNSTLLVGLGTRVRISQTGYVTAEVSPRVAGFRPGPHQISVGIERRAGGHLFQLNVSNGFGTTMGHLARGGVSYDDWYLGFNISRKFFR